MFNKQFVFTIICSAFANLSPKVKPIYFTFILHSTNQRIGTVCTKDY